MAARATRKFTGARNSTGTVRTQDLWTLHKARRDVVVKLCSKRPSKQEKPANARNEGTNFSRRERGGRESSTLVLNCYSDERREPSFQEFGQSVQVTNFSMSPQRYRSSKAQLHVSTTPVIGAAVSRIPGATRS